MLTTPDDYVNQLYPEDEELQFVIEAIRKQGMPEVSVAPAYGRLLTMLVQTAGARNILEIGALGGYSGICLCRGLPADGKLTSLELKEEYAELAGRHLEKAGFKDQVEYRIGPVADSLAALKQEGRTFDFSLLMPIRRTIPYTWIMLWS